MQVLGNALAALGLACIPLSSPDAAGVAQDPAREDAFICNLNVRSSAGLLNVLYVQCLCPVPCDLCRVICQLSLVYHAYWHVPWTLCSIPCTLRPVTLCHAFFNKVGRPSASQ